MNQVQKRNGTIVEFSPEKITTAISKAFSACNTPITEEKLSEMTAAVLMAVKDGGYGQIPSVEKIQDVVELVIMNEGFHEVAKAYIIYRYEHEKIREKKQEEVIEKIEDKKLSITKRSGKTEHYSEKKIEKTLARVTSGYEKAIDVDSILTQLKLNVYEGITTTEITRAIIQVMRSMIELDPAYSKVAARLLLQKLYRDVFGTNFEPKDILSAHAKSFPENIKRAVADGLLDARMLEFDLDNLVTKFELENDELFEYMGLEILASRYFQEDPKTKKPIETPQMFWMRIAMGTALNEKPEDRTRVALEFYEVLSRFLYTPGGRTLFQAGAKKAQLANCFLNVVPDSLDAIFKTFGDNAQYLKWSGGTGTSWTPLRATGGFISGTGVGSQGVVPFLKIANDINIAINRSGKRRGAGCVYLETWHLDIEDFLELRKNTGDERRRTHDVNTANWIPDLFMKRVRDGKEWTLFSPDETPDLHEIYGAAFEKRYEEYEKMADEGKIKLFKRLPATDIWKKMISMLFETGHPWITFKDPCNVRSPQDHAGVVHSSNLCTEITLNTNANETAVCTLGSLNFAKFVKDGKFDHELVESVTRSAVRMLDNVIDVNFYPTEDARRGSTLHRPVGLGVRGYHDALYLLGIDFDSEEAVKFADESMEVVAYYTILASSELAKERGVYSTYKGSKWDRGLLPQDTVDLLETERGEKIEVERGGVLDWTPVRESIKKHGMRNSNVMAIAPTASTANLAGCIPCVEPIYKNIYVKSNKEGDFVVVNKYLVEDLKRLGLWSRDMLNKIKFHDGSIQNIAELPRDIRKKYKEVFEIDSRWLIDAAARRAKWIDQSQSLNIFFRGTSGKELSEIYFYAWKKGLKTTYYLRSLGASQVEKSTVSVSEFGNTHKRDFTVKSADAVVSIKEEIKITSAPSEDQKKADAEFMARVARGEEVGICESCQG
ncbi:MAG: ribonucleoside-diphosphate reductase subunit alpha [Candidatus Pacebacteria bacterium]|jgi:ribonucleoside-diphosphate reductase alpha chain|nr:ribonucleoside-diphosphate reductase subunit alpha [Candidatus Paceibacterota bacterium]